MLSASGTDLVSDAFLDWLDRDLRSLRVDIPDLPFDFALGWVGYIGYELKAQCGGNRVHRSAEPDAVMVFADRAVVFDHQAGVTYLLALTDDRHEEAAQDWLRQTAARLEGLAGRRTRRTWSVQLPIIIIWTGGPGPLNTANRPGRGR